MSTRGLLEYKGRYYYIPSDAYPEAFVPFIRALIMQAKKRYKTMPKQWFALSDAIKRTLWEYRGNRIEKISFEDSERIDPEYEYTINKIGNPVLVSGGPDGLDDRIDVIKFNKALRKLKIKRA